jgi:hypothetical protein
MVLPPQYASSLAQIERYGMLILIFLLFTGTLNSVISFFVNPMLRIFLGKKGLLIFFRYVM